MVKIRIFNTNLKNNKNLFASFITNQEYIPYSKHQLLSDTFMSKKLARFVFPKKDLVDPNWVVTQIPPFVSLQHLLNISWDRLSEGEMKIWDNMCQRRVRDKEVSKEGLYKTSYDLRKDRGDFKRECQKIKYIDQNKKVKTTILKQLMLSDNFDIV